MSTGLAKGGQRVEKVPEAGRGDHTNHETALQCRESPGILWGTVTQSQAIHGMIKAVIVATQANKGQDGTEAVHQELWLQNPMKKGFSSNPCCF